MKRSALTAGIILLGLIWLGPLLDIYRDSFFAHMLAHMGVVTIAAPLIAIGLVGSRWNFSGKSGLFTPIPASLVELLVVWAWHAPALRSMAQASLAVTVLEQASFLAAGVLLWLSCLGDGFHGRDRQSAAGAFALLLTSLHMTLLGALLALTPRPLYGFDSVTCLGFELDAVQDQQLGGVAMLLMGAAAYLTGGVALLARLLSAPSVRHGSGVNR
ncbi:cytochrome-c oxidase [Pseudaminobacter arsenicus]|uniref:Cytochrome-c oxidase n=1 Tax=Borborobacter arsenicus TaxID=1851146 RepID=A0A432UZ74_9HYPH|nr:cytochrome c oxidase assembly protein [Pseudaminobacter arsenicus]RUM95210.1 cytochrome-c oxidase [Pseudaminobacter arsenicus]